jgi:hypothetical protein
MTAEEQIARLEEQLAYVLEQLRLKDEQLHLAQEQLRVAQARIEELEKQKTPPPPFVKANVAKPKAEQKQRKKRDAKHNHGRPREAPTRTVDHLIKYCPVCTSALGGISVARRRQVIELPPPPPVEVTEHVVYHGWCSQCGTWREAGSNGYVWCACTPHLRYYEYHHSRGNEVVTAMLGASFEGVLGSDFYASYNVYAGQHQRCWVHLLRDRHELKEQYPEHADVRASGQGCQSRL